MRKLFLIFVICLLSLFAWGQEDYDDLGNAIDQTASELSEPINQINQNPPPADSLLEADYIKDVMSTQMKKMIMDYIKENPFSKMSKAEVENLILTQVKDKPAEQVIKNFPKAFDAFVAWVRDPKAIPAFLGIVNKPRVAKNYGIAVIVVFVLSFALNLLNTKGNIFSRIFKKLMIMLGATGVNFALFYVFFKPEISPTLDVLSRHLF